MLQGLPFAAAVSATVGAFWLECAGRTAQQQRRRVFTAQLERRVELAWGGGMVLAAAGLELGGVAGVSRSLPDGSSHTLSPT